MGEMTVPLTDLGNGRWGSPSPAWNHLIMRESSGNPTIIQQIHDVNSGGNEAEGLFQITPRTWRGAGGTEFAPSARRATPHQQAIVAARIFLRNPSGSDWGAGRPGREDPRELAAGLVPVNAPPAPPPEPYGMPRGSNSGGYGGTGVRFPDWVYRLGDAFGVKPSTYPGHQESNRNEAGYAPNPQNLNRGIDWAAPGAPDQWDRLTRFADYLATIPQYLEQVIWQNPKTMRSIEIAGGRHQPGYFAGDLAGHRDHVHTRQSRSIPLPGGTVVPAPTPVRPQFDEREMFGNGSGKRSRPPINFFIHTEEGNGTAESLARYCQGQNGVSYHYTLRDRIVYDVVDTDLYSWSVLEANVFSINLCFAGSRAAFTREQWLQREADIEIAAYLAVQDARKYGFSTEVIPPPYNGAARPGISDHKYVTQKLGIGTHTDVGPNFPWDVFTRYVNKYAQPSTAPGDDMALVPQDQWDRVYRELTQRHPSRSPFRHVGEGTIDTWAGIDINADAHGHVSRVIEQARLGHPESLALLREVAAADPVKHPERRDDALLAQAVLASLSDEPQTRTPGSSAVHTEVAALQDRIASLEADNKMLRIDLDQERAESQRLREAGWAQTAPQPAPSAAVVPVEQGGSWGDIAGRVINSVEDWTELLMSMNAEQRQALSAGLKALELPISPNGDK